MDTSKMVKSVLGDMRKTIDELYSKNFVRDYRQESCRKTAKTLMKFLFLEKIIMFVI